MSLKEPKLIAVLAIVFIIATFGSYTLFSKNNLGLGAVIAPPAPPPLANNGAVVFDPKLPKTESCPLNGVLYSKQQKNWWEKHRPLGIMIENHQDARPQSGVSFADVVYEAVAEGGITRFLAMYYCQDAPQVGPVRSARTYFLDFVSEYGDYPLYAHVGGANTPGLADALSQINEYGWGAYNDMNQFSIGFPTFWRDYNRLGHETATEHTMYSTTTKLWDIAKSRGLTNVDKKGDSWDKKFTPYEFKEDASSGERPASQTIHLEFWSNYGQYAVDWDYNKPANNYLRKNGGAAHLDKDNNVQLSAKTVVVLYMRESNANDGYENNLHLLYQTKGKGKASVFMDGKEVKANWRKDSRTARLILTDINGEVIKFDKGTIWFEILPLNGTLNAK